MPVVKVKGIPVELAGELFVVPPVSLGVLEQMHDQIKAVTGDISDLAQVATITDVTLAALRRNYPDLTRERLADLLDVGNMIEVFQAVMDVSGLRRKAREAEPAAGEGGAPGE